jgi:hypothetical protein
VDTLDEESTYGIIVKCARITVGTGATPVHFMMMGDNRDYVEGERPANFGQKIRTRYWVHMLTDREAALLPTGIPQAILRGCSDEHEINNFLRIVVNRYLLDSALERLVMVQNKRRRDGGRYYNEAVIVAYAIGHNTHEQVAEGKIELGLLDHIQTKRVEYGGINFEMMAGHKEIKGLVPEYVYRDRPVVVLSYIHNSLTHGEVIDLLEQIMDLRYVGYWILREPYIHRPRSLVVGLSSTIIPRVPDTPLLRRLLDAAKKGWKSERPRLLFRQGPPIIEEVSSPSVVSGNSSLPSHSSMPTSRPLAPRPLTPRTYSAVAATPAEQQMLARSDMIVAMEQHWAQCEQRLRVTVQEQMQQYTRQYDQRLTSNERTTTQLVDSTAKLADRVDDLAKKNEETDAKLDRIMEQEDRIVGRLSMEIRESIGSLLGERRNE